jgi:hypothetical protein
MSRNLKPTELPERQPNPGDEHLDNFYRDKYTGEIFKSNESPMDKKFHLNVSTDKEGVIKFLTGKAQDPEPRPKALSVNGTLTAPFNYYAGRKELLDKIKTQCRLEINTDGKTIILFVDDKSGVATDSVKGSLTDNKALMDWSINTSERYSVREFVNHIRQRKYQFLQHDEAQQLITELLSWHVKIEKEVKEFNDNRGNSLSSFETRITQIKLKDRFQLNLPIYTGYPKQTFTVEIGVEPVQNGAQLFLISDELAEIQATLVDQYIGDELAKFEKAGFDCSRIFQ